MQFLAIWVDGGAPPGTLKRGEKQWACACRYTPPPVGGSQYFLMRFQRQSAKSGSKHIIRVLYTLRLQPSLLGHGREFCWESLPDATSASVSHEKSVFTCDLCVGYGHSHRWRAVQGRPNVSAVNSRDEPLAWHESLTNTPLSGWSNQLIARLTGESGMCSSSLEKELLKALLNVSLFCLCRSIVASITYGCAQI